MTYRHWMIPILLVIAPLAAAQQTVLLDKSEIRFISKQMNVPVEGAFKRFTANASFDPAQPQASRAELSIDLDSIDLGNAEAEAEAKSKGWFDTANHRYAKFVSTAIKNMGPNKYQATGMLTIKGISKELTVPITTQTTGATTLADARFMIKRLDYKIGSGPWADTSVVADEVEVRVKLTLANKP